MSFDKAIAHGKEKRKLYYRAKAKDATCRNGGSCAFCRENRLHKYKWREDVCAQKVKEEKEVLR